MQALQHCISGTLHSFGTILAQNYLCTEGRLKTLAYMIALPLCIRICTRSQHSQSALIVSTHSLHHQHCYLARQQAAT